MKIKMSLSSAGRRAAALLSIVVIWSAVQAAGVNPDIDISNAACGVATQPQTPRIMYAAKAGENLATVPVPIGVKGAGGSNVFWSLQSSQNTGCKGDLKSIQCGPASNTTFVDPLFNVVAPPDNGSVGVDPTTAAGQVSITSVRTLKTTDIGRTGSFGVTVSKAPNGDSSCKWDYTVHAVSAAATGGWGDPHMTTVDGVHYDFQGAGEYTALKGDKLEIQTRQKAVPTTAVPGGDEYTGLGVCVSIYTAVAAMIGSNRVSLQPDPNGPPDSGDLQVFVNGQPVPLSNDGAEYTLGAGGNPKGEFEGRIVKAPRGAYYEFDDAKGTQLVAAPAYWESQQTWYMNLSVYQASATQGIWGRLADDSWLPALPDGTNVGRKPQSMDPNPDPDFLLKRYQALYDKFGTAWRVTDTTSRFTYATGTTAPATNTATFTVADWPRFKPQNCLIPGKKTAEPTTPAIAAQACNGITDAVQKANCTFDVQVTGNTGFAQTYTTMQGFQPNGSGWQPALVAVQGGPPPTSWPWWWWILILVLILLVVWIVTKKKTP